MPRKRKSLKCEKLLESFSIHELIIGKPVRKMTIIRRFSKVQKNKVNYLPNLKNVVKSISFGVVEKRIETVSRIIMDTMTEYSKTATDYLSSKLKYFSPSIANQIDKFLFPNIKKVKIDKSDLCNSFILRGTNDGSARSIIAQLWDCKKIQTVTNFHERVTMLRKIIRLSIRAMTDLEIHLFIKLMLPTNNLFPNIINCIDDRNKYITCVNNCMRNNLSVLDIVIQHMQSWYLIQPVVLEMYKIAGSITPDIDHIITDLDALYENYLFVKHDNKNNKKIIVNAALKHDEDEPMPL